MVTALARTTSSIINRLGRTTESSHLHDLFPCCTQPRQPATPGGYKTAKGAKQDSTTTATQHRGWLLADRTAIEECGSLALQTVRRRHPQADLPPVTLAVPSG